jgi:hypothetical protein
MNQMNICEGNTAVVEHKDKTQAVGLEIANLLYSAVTRLTRCISKALPSLSIMMIGWK